jgi:DNA topoisomerase-1
MPEKYTLIVTEKPDAAQRIAMALDTKGKPRRMQNHKVPYYVAERNGEIVVVPALGHLYTVAAAKSGRTYPVFAFKWVPRHEAERGAGRIRVWLSVISKLAENADVFVDACDYDIEGSIIGYNILKYACIDKDQTSKRMKYSTLTKKELEKAYDELLPHLDFELVKAGLARHEIDWFYGINLTRALTTAAKEGSKQYATLSTGRVQGPTLRFLAAREKTIRTFVPTPYWTLKAQLEIDGQTYTAEHEKETIQTKKEADTILRECKRKNGQIEKIEIKQFQQPPPFPFDLGALQSEAYRLFGYTPKRILNVAQRLYLDALISYPRTSSQKLPSTIDYRTILENLGRKPQYRNPTAELLKKQELVPNEGTKKDTAHPAIYPTGNLPERTLDISENNVLDLIVRRFMAVFAEPAIRRSTKAYVNINGHCFHIRGGKVLKEGWLRYYTLYTKSEESILPPLEETQTVNIKKVVEEERFTKPPPRYNPASILRKMEEQGIGTKATRAEVIQTLYNRKYVKDERMAVTDLGFEVLAVLEKYCPAIVSVALTRELEAKMNEIQTRTEKRERILAKAVETLEPALQEMKKNEKTIGEQLNNALRESRLEERTIGTCPTCKTGKLVTLYSRKTGKRFAGCTNYFKGLCKTSFPLPPRGAVKSLRRNCSRCGWPMVEVRMKEKRPWMLCLNPECPSKEDRRSRIEVHSMQ